MDEVAPSANAGCRSIPLKGRGDRGAIRSLVTADTCLGPSESYLNERGSKSSMLGAMCQAQSGNCPEREQAEGSELEK